MSNSNDFNIIYEFATSGTTEVAEGYHHQLIAWGETQRLPDRTYWSQLPKKELINVHVPDINFDKSFRKHMFKVGRSKK